MAKIAVNAGHTASGAGYGAIGYFKESIETRKIVQELIPLLKQKGHTVIDATVDKASTQLDYLQKSVQIANKAKADLFLTIHLNASASHNGNGAEIYTWKCYEYKEAVNILNELAKCGFKNRGIKKGDGFYVIKKTTMTALLVEVFFCDNRKDAEIYRRVGAKGIAEAISKALG